MTIEVYVVSCVIFFINRRTSPDQCDGSMAIGSGSLAPSKSYETSTYNIQPTSSHIINTTDKSPTVVIAVTPASMTPAVTPVMNTTQRASAQSVCTTLPYLVLITFSVVLNFW